MSAILTTRVSLHFLITRPTRTALACCTTCPCCSCTPRLLATTRRPRTCMLRPDAHWHQHGDREVLRSGRKRSLFVAVLLGCRSAANTAARVVAPSTTAADARPSVTSHSAMASGRGRGAPAPRPTLCSLYGVDHDATQATQLAIHPFTHPECNRSLSDTPLSSIHF